MSLFDPIGALSASEGDSSDDSGGMWGILGATALGGLLGYAGQEKTNKANLELGREQMAFQERMSGSAYQRAVKDMQAAGLNPMLSAHAGGATSPVGNMPVMQNSVGAGVSSAAQGAGTIQAAQQIAQSKAQTEQIQAQSDKIRSETMEKNLNTALLQAQVRGGKASALRTEEEIPGVRGESASKVAKSLAERGLGGTDTPGFSADVARRKAEARSAELGLSGAEAESKFYQSDMGVDSPYIKQLLGILRGLSSAFRSR